MTGTSGFGGRTLRTGNPHHQNRPSSMRSGMPGERSTTRSTREAPSGMLCKRCDRTAFSGHGRSTRDAKFVPRATQWAKASPKVLRVVPETTSVDQRLLQVDDFPDQRQGQIQVQRQRQVQVDLAIHLGDISTQWDTFLP